MTRAQLVFGTAAAAVLVHALNGCFGWGFLAPTGFALAMDAVLLFYLAARRDGVLLRRATVGLLSGLCVLASDWVCIRFGGLRYAAGGPFLFLSPLYIPISFVGAVVQLGELYEHGERRAGAAAALSLTTAAGLLYIPLFEYCAKTGRLWRYEGVAMLFDTIPYYILFGELILGLGIGLATRAIAARPFRFSLLAGAALGLTIVASMLAGCLLLR